MVQRRPDALTGKREENCPFPSNLTIAKFGTHQGWIGYWQVWKR